MLPLPHRNHFYRAPEIPLEPWQKLVEDAKSVIGFAASHSGTIAAALSLTDDWISFSGEEGFDGEQFFFPRKLLGMKPGPEGLIYQSCNTGRYPYDDLVAAVLTLAVVHLGHDYIAVDCDSDVQFIRGYLLAAEATNRVLPPLEVILRGLGG